jgi:hypothetical protein
MYLTVRFFYYNENPSDTVCLHRFYTENQGFYAHRAGLDVTRANM